MKKLPPRNTPEGKLARARRRIRVLTGQLALSRRSTAQVVDVNDRNAKSHRASEVYALRLEHSIQALQEENQRMRLGKTVFPLAIKLPTPPRFNTPGEYDDLDKPVPAMALPERIDVRLPIAEQFAKLDALTNSNAVPLLK